MHRKKFGKLANLVFELHPWVIVRASSLLKSIFVSRRRKNSSLLIYSLTNSQIFIQNNHRKKLRELEGKENEVYRLKEKDRHREKMNELKISKKP